jgi:type III secretory pathway component EscS
MLLLQKQKRISMNTNILEKGLLYIFNLIFALPYNAGVIILAALFWFLTFFFQYSSTGNFNLFATIENYIVMASLVGIIFGILNQKNNNQDITKWSIISFLFSCIALFTVKILTLHWFGAFIVTPISFYIFCSLLKRIWQQC